MHAIFPVALHAGHVTVSPSSAIRTPFMLPWLLAEVTLPPAVVEAPKVMW
jgi:hypothetical protein